MDSADANLNEIQRAAQEQFARQSHCYGAGHILENVEDVREVIEPLHLGSGARALDVATGAGHTGLFLAELGCDVTLGDIARPMLERAREAAARRGLTVKIQLHAAENFPCPNAVFDLVTCRVAAHHFSSPDAFVSETARVLQPGGHFLVIDGTVEDNQPEAEAWMHAVEKCRDPSHHRFLTPGTWRQLCEVNGLAIQQLKLTPFKQPDLNWYFETAGTTAENRAKVLALVQGAPESARRLFRLAREDGKVVWWWQRLTLLAQKI